MGCTAAFPLPATTFAVRARGRGGVEILLPHGRTDTLAERNRFSVVVAFRGDVGRTHARTARIQITEWTRIGAEDVPAQSPAERVGGDPAQELQS